MKQDNKAICKKAYPEARIHRFTKDLKFDRYGIVDGHNLSKVLGYGKTQKEAWKKASSIKRGI